MKPTTISFFSFLLVSLVLLGGCDRGEPAFPARITGKALNLATNLPEPGVMVKVQILAPCQDPLEPECWATLDSGLTNDQGYFDISYVSPSDNLLEARLAIKGFKEGFFNLSDPGSSITVTTDSTIVDVYPKA